MNKFIHITMLLFILTGCTAPDQYDPNNWEISKKALAFVHVDPATGCEYIGTSMLVYRIDRDGETHMGCGSVLAINEIGKEQ